MPRGFEGQLADMIDERLLAACYDFGLKPGLCLEADNPGGNARYIGIELRK